MRARTASGPTVATACPLDCPDSCSLDVTVDRGRVTAIDGSGLNPVTGGYICAKVRRFTERQYGADRLLYPAVRTGAKGDAVFRQATWDEALGLVAHRLAETRERWGGEAILPFFYGGSNGLLTQNTADARLFRRLGASRLARTVCATPTAAALDALYGKMPSVAFEDFPEARLIVLWGANPSASGIHLVPYVREAQRRGATLVVVDPRTTPLARQADFHLAVRPGTDLPVALAIHRVLFEEGHANETFLSAHTRGAEALRGRARPWTVERAAEVAGLAPADLRRVAELYAGTTPALLRCGWGQERNRNGGNATLAILALPAVAGKFGVRGGGYTMNNSAAWRIQPTWIGTAEPATRVVNMNRLGRALLEYDDPAVKTLFVYNCNPAATVPDQRRILHGLERDDLFTVVFEQVMTDTARYADLLLPATTFLEHYDVAKAYGPISLRLVKPVVEPAGEARPNADVFAELSRRLALDDLADARGEAEEMLGMLGELPAEVRGALREHGAATPPWDGRPVQFRDVWPLTPDGKVDLFPAHLAAQAPAGLYGYQADPATADYPLALISPASERSISSTLAELPRPEVGLIMHPDDAAVRGLKRFSNRPCTTWGGRGTSARTDAGGPMRAYSMDLRERALLDSDAGMTAADVAAKYRVSGSWVRLLKQRRRDTGEVAPRVQRHGRRCMLEPHLHTLAALIAAQPDRTLAELKDALATPASVPTVWRAVRALGLTVNKNGPPVRTRSA